MNNIECVLFDLDGTLTNPFVGIKASVEHALDKMKITMPPDDVIGRFIGPPLLFSFGEFCGMEKSDAERAVAFYREYYESEGVFALEVYDGVVDMLKSLKAAGKRLYISTSKPEKFAQMIADRFFDCVDGVAGASQDFSRIEKIDVMRYAVDKFNIMPKRSVMVGDRVYDVLGAKDVGMDCIGVLYGYGKKDEFVEAKYTAKTPADVVKIITG